MHIQLPYPFHCLRCNRVDSLDALFKFSQSAFRYDVFYCLHYHSHMLAYLEVAICASCQHNSHGQFEGDLVQTIVFWAIPLPYFFDWGRVSSLACQIVSVDHANHLPVSNRDSIRSLHIRGRAHGVDNRGSRP
jgi:hypothetical protein